MSALEFAAAVKWPVTVLILAAMAAMLLKRNPGTRRSMGAWLNHRNLRLHLAGQEFEATLAETQGSMDLAAGNDSELAAVVREPSPPGTPEATDTDADQASEVVEAARRTAVEGVMRSGVLLGWQLAKGGLESPPSVSVSWTDHGHPSLSVSRGSSSAMSWEDSTFRPPRNVDEENLRRLHRRFQRDNLRSSTPTEREAQRLLLQSWFRHRPDLPDPDDETPASV